MSKTSISKQDLLDKGMVEVSPGIWSKAPKQATPAKPNKFHAVKVRDGNEVYDSKREYAFKNMLLLHKIDHVMKTRYVVQPPFEYMGKKIKEIAIIPDFIIMKHHVSVAIVDIKGKITEVAKIKFKMLKHKLSEMGHPIPIMMPTSKKEMDETIIKLLDLTK